MGTKRKRKRFTPEFKAEIVIEALSDESSDDWIALNRSEE